MSSRPTIAQSEARPRFVARSAPIVATVTSVTLGAPRVVTTVLVTVCLVMVVVLGYRGLPGAALDRTLVVAGSGTVAVILIGMTLGILPAGLTEKSWVLSVSVVALAAVLTTLKVSWPVPQWASVATHKVTDLGWYLAAAGVVVVSLALSVTATLHADAAPVALALQAVHGTDVTVAVSSGRPSGPLTLSQSNGRAHKVLRDDLRVAPGHTVSVTLHLDPARTETVRLQAVDSAQRVVAELHVSVPARSTGRGEPS